jgi:hypothetical protein
VKWAKRHPSVAALIAVSGLAALELMGLMEGLRYNGRLHVALREAGTQKAQANRQREYVEALELAIRYEHLVPILTIGLVMPADQVNPITGLRKAVQKVARGQSVC